MLKKIVQLIVKSAGKAVVVSVLVSLCWLSVNALSALEDRRHPVPIRLGEQVVLDKNLLAARVIALEEEAGVATDPDRARRILHSVLEEARSLPAPMNANSMTMKKYLGEIGKLLGSYFYYKRSTTFTEGLNSGALDCDLLSILYQSIAKQEGVDIGIIYSPGHAFVGWQSYTDDVSIYWETTSRFGNVAGLGQRMYRESVDTANYKIRTQIESEDLYASWIFAEAFDRNRKEENLEKVLLLGSKYPAWEYPQMAKLFSLFKAYGIEDERTKVQLREYLKLNDNDDFGKRMLMQHYKTEGDSDKGLEIFGKIEKRELIPEDFDIASELSDSMLERAKYHAISTIFGGMSEGNNVIFDRPMKWEEFSTLVAFITILTAGWIIWPWTSVVIRRF